MLSILLTFGFENEFRIRDLKGKEDKCEIVWIKRKKEWEIKRKKGI